LRLCLSSPIVGLGVIRRLRLLRRLIGRLVLASVRRGGVITLAGLPIFGISVLGENGPDCVWPLVLSGASPAFEDIDQADVRVGIGRNDVAGVQEAVSVAAKVDEGRTIEGSMLTTLPL
jgi:hypothetical protein